MKNDKVSEMKWVLAPEKLNSLSPFLKATPLRPVDANTVEYSVESPNGSVTCPILNQNTYLMSNGEPREDMSTMDILNEPQVLSNLITRYNQDKIFTYIGPTLIVINPYRYLPEVFSDQIMSHIRHRILNSTQDSLPHIYYLAGKAYQAMITQRKKQAIVISGESGAGKTQSAKYCMKILTALSHAEQHPIQAKILACNPILEAFGNSKTLRNDNSSRFGKYLQIYFSGDNTIIGASIKSYLLEKSRVVSISEGERSFHIFYALIESKILDLNSASHYRYLSQSQCYKAKGIEDEQYFHEVARAMGQMGFSKNQQLRIWELLSCILGLGNVVFNDQLHMENQSHPCVIMNNKELFHLAKCLDVPEENFEKMLLFEKKHFLKEFTYSPYNKDKCYGNINTLSKAIYNSIFEFILHKIQISLQPKTLKNTSSINILDIFGFENFLLNSFEQFCINFTNEKLLKLYNSYIFEKEMQILKEDGLQREIASIKPPTNDQIISMISGNFSMFSIINDLTMPQQYKDSDIISGFAKIKSDALKFDKINQSKFMICHSQCDVSYIIDGFKTKNQDKVLPQITNIVQKLFANKNSQQAGKTILSKFSKEINDLVDELQSSNVHFIRCIKPNEKKRPHFLEEFYILSQIRYLGIFETIQIRKKTFPARWLYKQFVEKFGMLFPKIKVSNDRTKTERMVLELASDKKKYLFGSKRIYLSEEIESLLNKKLFELMKVKVQKAKIIWKAYKKYKFKKEIFIKLKILAQRIRLWKKIATAFSYKIKKSSFSQIVIVSKSKTKIMEEEQMKSKVLAQKNKRQNFQKKKLKVLERALSIITVKQKAFYHMFFVFLSKQKSNHNNYYSVNETIIVDDDSRAPYTRNIQQKKQQNQFAFNESFIDEKSIYIPNEVEFLFNYTIPMSLKKHYEQKNLKKLKVILAEKYVFQYDEKEEDFFSPSSEDNNFQLDQTPHGYLNNIISFTAKDFYKRVLRKRTNFIGMKKNEDDILVAKDRPLSKSLTVISEGDEAQALKIFRLLVKIGDESKLDNVFKLIENMIVLCQGTSMHVKNEVFLQLLKQSNSPVQLSSVRILQCLSVFLHIYTPDQDFLMAGLHFFYLRISEKKYTQKQAEYSRYVFRKLIRKIEKPIRINYMPIKYQMMALMCKRKISIPVYLPIGNSILIRVESYETFADVKQRVIEQFGIGIQRLKIHFFTFFQIINFQNQELEEAPIDETQIVWDVITYWEKAKEKYKENGIVPPAFFLMLKIKYAFQCHFDDEQTIQLFFAQCYFDYFIGRIRLSLQKLSGLAACVKILKFSDKPQNQISGSYPVWSLNKYSEEDLINLMRGNVQYIMKSKMSEKQIKYRFLSICSENPLSLSMAIPTEDNAKLYLKPRKIYFAQKHEIIEEISVKNIIKWVVNQDKFIYKIRNKTEERIIQTEYARIISTYLSLLPSIIMGE